MADTTVTEPLSQGNGNLKLRHKILIIAAAFVLAAAVPLFIFFLRSPVLVVADHSSVLLYGASRSRDELLRASLVLFRRVREVAIADDAGDDILQFAIAEVSAKPFCVLFPLRFARAARFYREQNPEVPVILLEGRYAEDADPASSAIGGNKDDYFIFKTDITADFYLAGLAAAALDGGKNGKIAVFLESDLQTQAREAFLSALNDLDTPLEAFFFTSFAQFSEIPDLSCVVLTGAGADYFETNFNIPVIFFTWLDPSMVPANVVMVFDDSPWTQAVDAVRMVTSRMAKGQIPSRREVLPGNGIDSDILKKLRNLGRN